MCTGVQGCKGHSTFTIKCTIITATQSHYDFSMTLQCVSVQLDDSTISCSFGCTSALHQGVLMQEKGNPADSILPSREKKINQLSNLRKLPKRRTNAAIA